VPPGERAQWKRDPFGADIVDGVLYGRGATDMKSAIAAFVAAVARHLKKHGAPEGSISLLITGDEEGVAVNGTVKVLDWMKKNGETIDDCLVGEPTSGARVGDTIKIGRRGSMNVRLTVKGIQGHVAYPKLALNPIPIMSALIARLSAWTLDAGNPAVNVIPSETRAGFNIRFNDLHKPESLFEEIRSIVDAIQREKGGEIEMAVSVSGVSFLTAPGRYTEMLKTAVQRASGLTAEYSTTGGTSDARFIKDHCPVAELGLTGRTMHKLDECATLSDIEDLTRIYEAVLELYFAEGARR